MRHEMVKPVAFAVGGLAVGASVAYFATKSKFEKISNEEIASMREHYKMKEQELLMDKEDELEQIKQAHGLINHEDPREALKAYNARLDQLDYMKAEETAKVIEKVVGPKGDPGLTIPYNKIAKGKDAFEEAVKRVAGIEDEDTEELRVVDEEDDVVRQNIFEASIRQDVLNGNEEERSGPYVISVEEFQEESDEFEKTMLSYYDDGTLADERNMPIPDPNPIVGDDNLEKFGELSQDENIVYVRNERISTDFEITREEGSYADSFMKAKDWSDEDSPKTRPKRMREDG